MPSIGLNNIAAGTANALDGLKFQDIESPRGALITLRGSTAVAGGNVTYSVGGEDLCSSFQCNIELSADVVLKDDLILDREPVPSGKQFLAVDAQVCNIRLTIEELP